MNRLPVPGTHDWVELPAHYLGATCAALTAAGIAVAESWVDPMDPRDATILLAVRPSSVLHADVPLALVWDEMSGWRYGRFVSGRKGIRTRLDQERSFGGDLLPEPAMVAATMQCVFQGALVGATERPRFRHYADLGDGTDERLAAFAPQDALL
ncbi:DUF6292 family protein [Actinoallomurus sp. CA-150999]|uniref:DUF6292 family protein n=1 Tax=Actinoallomurus sp. CA-150999 TaxID=3239887 RepID=UPI003D901CF5